MTYLKGDGCGDGCDLGAYKRPSGRPGLRIVGSARVNVRQLPQTYYSKPTGARGLVRSSVGSGGFSRRGPSLYGMRSFSTLGEYDEFDGGLGKFKLKKVFKKIAAPVTKVTKKVVTAHKIAIASVASAVGVKSAAQKALKLTDKQMKLANKIGTVQRVAAIAAAGVVAAPYAGSVMTAAGKGALFAGKAAMAGGGGLLKKGIQVVGGLLKKQQAESPESEQDSASYAGETAASAAAESGSLPSEAQLPTADLPLPFQGAGSSAGTDPASAESAPNPLTEMSALNISNPKLLLAGAAISLFLFMPKKKRGRR